MYECYSTYKVMSRMRIILHMYTLIRPWNHLGEGCFIMQIRGGFARATRILNALGRCTRWQSRYVCIVNETIKRFEVIS